MARPSGSSCRATPSQLQLASGRPVRRFIDVCVDGYAECGEDALRPLDRDPVIFVALVLRYCGQGDSHALG